MNVRDLNAILLKQRQAMLRAGRALNTSLDFVFYDTGSLTPEESAGLSARPVPEGSILVVRPKSEPGGISKLTPFEFLSMQQRGDAAPIDAIVVAGVGSSDLGTAALARNVADYLGRPVAGIVSGYGLADMITEALGGWFVLGFKNSIRDGLAKMFDALEMQDHVWDDASYRSLVKDRGISEFEMDQFVFGSPDSAALLLALYHLRDRISLLVGHSKGNYVIENALEGLVSLCELKKREIPAGVRVVTLGAVVRFPAQFSNVTQFLGTLDWFGLMNSRRELDACRVPGAWHSLNTNLPGHMSVGEALKQAGVH